jgi:hypothetical protein
MLKDKIENDNYAELCEKAYKFITNGVVLPQTAKDPLEETMLNLSKAIQNGGNITDALPSIPKVNNNEEELKELAYKHLHRLVTYKDIPCYICGYSVEFDCLIAGTFENRGNGILLGDNDYVLYQAFYDRYFYVPKDIVKE